MFLPPLSENSTPHQSQHLGHILGCIVDLGNSLLSYQFWVTEPDGELVGVTRELLFEGNLLAFDPTYNVAEWVPMHGMASDLSPTKDLSTWELSNMPLMTFPRWNDLESIMQSLCQRQCPTPKQAPRKKSGTLK